MHGPFDELRVSGGVWRGCLRAVTSLPVRAAPVEALRAWPFDRRGTHGPYDRLRSFDKLRMHGPFDKLRANGGVWHSCLFRAATSFPVRAEPVEALHGWPFDRRGTHGPFDKLRANG